MPRPRASMATWLDGLPLDKAIAPPLRQSWLRKRDGVMSSAAITAPCGSSLRLCAGEMLQHAVADIGEVAGPGPEIFVIGGGIIGDLRIQRVAPGEIRRDTAGDLRRAAGAASSSSSSIATWKVRISAASPSAWPISSVSSLFAASMAPVEGAALFRRRAGAARPDGSRIAE